MQPSRARSCWAAAISAFGLATLLAACGSTSPPRGQANACDDGLKSAFKPDADTTVIAVRQVKKGEALVAVDSPSPITAAGDMCLVKLLVGPGATAEKDRTAKSWSEGIGIEIWLPAAWNERIRNYGGGGWVGGGHRLAGQIGSKVPAIVNANIGYAVGTTDAGQPWYQDGSFAFLSNGRINEESFRDWNERAMVEQAVKTQALVKFYYGRAQKFAYYDGHSQGGRQGLKIAQNAPELYDGYMIAQPAINAPRFGLAALYTQVVMKNDLGFTATDRPKAAAFARKVEAANVRAVASCDKARLGFLLDPYSCNYDPAKDAALLCAGVVGRGVTGSNADAATCMSRAEAEALDKIWYGPTRDGSFDTAETADTRSGKSLGARQLWWTFTRGTSISGNITSASTDIFAIAMQDLGYAASAGNTSAIPITNTSTPVRDKWAGLSYASFADGFDKARDVPALRDYMTDNADLSKLRSLGRKVLIYNGLADDAIPSAGAVNYYNRVAAGMGGDAQVQQFLRMYLLPGSAHSSQGRPFVVSGNANRVPLPKLPGNGNQVPMREQDQMFSALVDWVEKGVAPDDMLIASRDASVSYAACVYPKMITWRGTGSAKTPADFACQ
jgi:Tannase and feruloyl esterase